MKPMLCVLVVAVSLMLAVPTAWASCRTTTYILGGRVVICTTCCYGGNCTVTCF